MDQKLPFFAGGSKVISVWWKSDGVASEWHCDSDSGKL